MANLAHIILIFLNIYGIFAADSTCNNYVSENAENKHPFIKIGNKYYFINASLNMNWFEASYYCRSYGGELANIKSYAELLALQDYILAQEITSRLWIDGNDLAREGEYISHATGRPLTFTNWLPNNPDNSSNEDCLELYLYNKTLLMNDDNCDRKIFAICQYPERYRQKSLTYQNDNSILSGLVEAFAQTFQNCKSRALCPTS